MSAVVQGVGLILEVVGVLYLSGAYVRSASRSAKPMVLMSALWRGDTAKGAARVTLAEDRTEANLQALHGLALVVVGFFFQAAGVILGVLLPRT